MISNKSSAEAKLSRSLFPRGNKGITPIIATILLLMMVLAIAGSAFFWVSRIQNQMQGGAESFQSTLTTQMSSAVKVVGVEAGCPTGYNCKNMTIFFQNTGNTKIPVNNNSDYPTTTWILRDDNQITRCSANWNSTETNCTYGCGNNEFINVGEIKKVILNISTSLCAINGTYDRGKSFSFTVDFSGKTTASSSFIVPLS
jgi:flagellin-like protein